MSRRRCTNCFEAGHDIRVCPRRVRSMDLRSATVAMVLTQLIGAMNDYKGRVQAQLVSEDRIRFLFTFAPTERVQLILPGRWGSHAMQRAGKSLETSVTEIAVGELVTWTYEVNLACKRCTRIE